tara:strand:+ start:2062 stop:2277 length:216 start_codon:yes stop_codon:yes gene_type:complete
MAYFGACMSINVLVGDSKDGFVLGDNSNSRSFQLKHTGIHPRRFWTIHADRAIAFMCFASFRGENFLWLAC